MFYRNRAWLWRGLVLSLAAGLVACVAVVPTVPEINKLLRTATPRAFATLRPQITPVATQRSPATATALPAINYQLLPVATGFERPVYLTHAGDGSGRLFVVEQPGRVRIISSGKLQPEAFLDLSALVNSRKNERGLLGLAFHPQYARNGYFFVHYSAADGATAVARYHVSENAQRADAGSATLVLSQPQPSLLHRDAVARRPFQACTFAVRSAPGSRHRFAADCCSGEVLAGQRPLPYSRGQLAAAGIHQEAR